MKVEDKQEVKMKEFTGKVVEVHSGDSLTVERDGDFGKNALVRVFLASVKAPSFK